MSSMYKSTQYCGKHIQEYRVLWQANIRVYNIVASTYKEAQYHGQHVQGAEHHCHHVQEHTAS